MEHSIFLAHLEFYTGILCPIIGLDNHWQTSLADNPLEYSNYLAGSDLWMISDN